MAIITQCQTAHYIIQYDNTMNSGAFLANDLCQNAEDDYTLMASWFPGVSLPTPITVQIMRSSNPNSTNAQWCTCPNPNCNFCTPGLNGILVQIFVPDDPAQTGTVRYDLAQEVTEIFMWRQNRGWYGGKFDPAGNEGTVGEGLSTFLGQQLVIIKGLQTPFLNNIIVNAWMQSNRLTENLTCLNSPPPPVSCPTVDYEHPFAPNNTSIYRGYYMLFLYYLMDNLGYSINQIIDAAPSRTGSITEVYQNLTKDTSSDPNQLFLQLINTYYPGTTPLSDNILSPFPLGWFRYDSGYWYEFFNGQWDGWVWYEVTGTWYYYDFSSSTWWIYDNDLQQWQVLCTNC